MGDRWTERIEARGGGAPHGRRRASHRCRRRRSSRPRCTRRVDECRCVHRRPLLVVRLRTRRCRRRGGWRLLRPDRRGAVDASDDRRPPGTGRGDGRSHRPHVWLRLDPVGSWHLVHSAAGHRAVRRAVRRSADVGQGCQGWRQWRHRGEWHADVRGDGGRPVASQGGRRPVRPRPGGPSSGAEAARDEPPDARRPIRELGGAVRDGSDELRGGAAQSRPAGPAVGTRLHLRRDDDDRRRSGRGSRRRGG